MTRRFVLLSIITAIVILMTSPLPSYVLWGMKWPTGSTVVYRVNANTDDVANELDAVRAAASSWGSLNPSSLKMSYGGTTTGSVGYNGVNTVHWTNEDGGSTLALATVWSSGGITVEADMTFYDNHTWCTSGCNYDVQTVALHEFGHWMGLDHDTGIMAPSYSGIRRTIDSDNANGFYALYGAPATFSAVIDTPLNGQRVSGQVTIGCSVTMPDLLSELRLYIDGTVVKSGSTSPLYYNWDTLSASENTHAIRAEAVSTTSQTSAKQISVVVDNIHSLGVAVSPVDSGTVVVNPQKAEYSHGETVSLGATGQNGYLFYRWEGDHVGTVNPVTMSINRDMNITARFNQPPRLQILSPAPGASVWGSFELAADAHDDDGIHAVRFYIDDQLLFVDMAAPFQKTLNSVDFVAGLHRLKVQAVDRLGLSTTEERPFSISLIEIRLQAQRKEINSWMMSAQYGQLNGVVTNEHQVPVSVFVIYRQQDQAAYGELYRFSPDELKDGQFVFQDKYLQAESSYRYLVVALGADGQVVGSSSDVGI